MSRRTGSDDNLDGKVTLYHDWKRSVGRYTYDLGMHLFAFLDPARVGGRHDRVMLEERNGGKKGKRRKPPDGKSAEESERQDSRYICVLKNHRFGVNSASRVGDRSYKISIIVV